MTKRLSEKILITEPEEILKALRVSLHQGNVVGIFVKPLDSFMYLTAVEDIFSSAVTDEKIVVLKKLDLHGKLLEQNQLSLAEIYRVRFFYTLYKDGLHKTLKSMTREMDHGQFLIIRKRECDIQLHELKIILVKTLDSGHRISISVFNKDTSTEGYIKDFDSKLEKVILTASINDKQIKELSIPSIARIEFESFFQFKGLSSKIFNVLPEVTNRIF